MSACRLVNCLIIAGLVGGCRQPATLPAEEKIPPAPVKWEGVRRVVLEEWTELVGTTEPLPDHAARVTAPVEGRVVSVLQAAAGKPIAEGQIVEAGDVLVKLDDTVMRANRDKAVAAKKVLQAEKEASDFAVKQADIEVKRVRDLKQLASPIVVEQATVALETAQAHVRADDVKLVAADDEIASLDRQLKLYTLAAPRKGRLGRLQVVIGQTLTPGTVVADVIDVENEISVLCYVAPADARKLQVGQPARAGGDKGLSAEGKVAFIAEQAEPDSGLIAVKVRLPNKDLKLRANAITRFRVLTTPGRACWAIPEAALMEDQDPPAVIVIDDIKTTTGADGKPEQAGTARRLRAMVGLRDRVLKQVELVRLEDPEKKWKGDLEHTQVVIEKGQGLQTGDAVKLEADEDEEPAKP
jgi:membrane fusion protein (multidrug efflux system)